MRAKPQDRESLIASVAFIHLPGLFGQKPARCFDAIQELHFCLQGLRFPKGVTVLSAASGAIVVAPDAALHGEKTAIHHFFKDIFSACPSLPLRIGVTHGTVEFFADVERGTYIGEPVNIAARLATATENVGLLYETDYYNFRQVAIDNDSLRPIKGKKIIVHGKAHDKGFLCFEAVDPPAVPKDFSGFAQFGHKGKQVAAFIVTVDLPHFSSGTKEVLSKRFRAFVGAAHKLLADHVVQKIHYSPGGDGGVFVFPKIKVGQIAQTILDRFATELAAESQLQTVEASVESRIGAHYGLVQIYKNAQNHEVPTGHDCFVAEQITKGIAPGSIVCSEILRKEGGHYFIPNPPTSPVGPIQVPFVGLVGRYLLKGTPKVPVISAVWKCQLVQKHHVREIDLIISQSHETLKCFMLVSYVTRTEIICVMEYLTGTIGDFAIKLIGKHSRYIKGAQKKGEYKPNILELVLANNNTALIGTISNGTTKADVEFRPAD